MAEKNLAFDNLISRKGTNCLKYDFAVERGKTDDLLPLWVADMDFRISSYIQEALQRQVEHGIFGYSDGKEDYFRACADWMEKHHHIKLKQEWLLKTPGVVFAIAMAIQAYTGENDAVLIQSPVYYPFSEVVTDNQRKLVSSDLMWKDGTYEIDFDDFEKKIVDEKVKLFILCNPHNPVGRVWTREELLRIGEICLQNKVMIISDEIHADFVFRGEQNSFFSLPERLYQNAVLCTSPSKTFNLAGLQISNIFIPDEENRKAFQKRMDACGYSQPNIMGLIGCQAAYEYGEEWYQKMMEYLRGNAELTKSFLQKNLPKVRMSDLQGTYLVWLDCREYGYSDQELNDRVIHKGRLWLDSGEIFGTSGSGFQRINIACPREILKTALERLKIALES